MRSRAIVTVVVTIVLVLLWVPSASAKVKWTYGNGQSDLAVDLAPGTAGAVCGTSITGFAGEGTTVDPSVTPPPAPSTSGIGVELYVTPSNQDVGGSTVESDGLHLLDGSVIPPLQTVTTQPPTAIDPLDNVYYDFQDNPIWEYSAAPFTFTLPSGTPAYSNVLVHRVGRSAYFTSIAVDCTTTTLTSSANPSAPGQSVTLTATVKTALNAAVTQGGVEFLVDGTPVSGSVAVNASGQAAFTTSWAAAGGHTVTANYLGANSYQSYWFTPSSASLDQTVSATSGDTTAPTFGECTGGPFLLRTGNRPVSVTASDEPAGSGLDEAASTLTGSVRTGTVGFKRVTFTATDNAGNSATQTCRYRVKYVFSGFRAPVDNDLLNVAKAGLTVPFRFTVTDGRGVPVTDLTKAVRSSSRHQCHADPSDAIEEYTTGAVGLQNLGGGAYQVNVPTATTWAGTCRLLTLTLADGLPRSADFRFRT
jgi:hypothetical protein